MIETITLDTRKDYSGCGKAHISPIRRGERNNVQLTVFVRRDSKPYDLTGMTAHLVWQAAGGKLVGPVPMDVTDQAEGTVRCTLPDACYSAVGMARAYIELRRGAEMVDTTDEMSIKVLDCIDADGEQAEEYMTLIAEVREATDSAVKAAARAESGEDGRVKAETSRVSAETARDQAETERTNGWANLKADAQAAIADVKATEAKLYPAAENVLKGTAKDTLVHADDAFAGAALRGITVEGACRQDGTPSPDNPVPIQVIENPVIQIRGKNLLKYPFAYSYDNPASISGITYTDNGDGSISVEGTATADSFYNLDFTSDVRQLVGKTISMSKIPDGSNVYFEVGVFLEDGSLSTLLSTYGAKEAKVPEHAAKLRTYISVGAGNTVNTTIWPCIYIAGEDDKFAKYASQEQAFTLPSEHPYLTKLPDGTADEITVDRDGNVELVALVGKSTAAVSDGVGGEVGTDALSSTGAIADGAVVYYKLATPVTYPLGEVTVPSLPDSISNVWTDAEVTPNTGIEYVRDVNIVVANLESAIASITKG